MYPMFFHFGAHNDFTNPFQRVAELLVGIAHGQGGDEILAPVAG